MTRKDYNALARVLNDSRRYGRMTYTEAQRLAATATIDSLAHDLANALTHDNPRFDRDRFLIAAGVPR